MVVAVLLSPPDNCVTVMSEVSVPVPAVVLPVPVGKEMTVVCPEVSVVVGDPVPVSVVVGEPVSVLVSVAVPVSVVPLIFKIRLVIRTPLSRIQAGLTLEVERQWS